MKFKTAKDQRQFEDNALCFLSVVANAVNRYKQVGCFYTEITGGQWDSFRNRLKKRLNLFLQEHHAMAADKKTSLSLSEETDFIDYIAFKQDTDKEKTVYHLFLFFNAAITESTWRKGGDKEVSNLIEFQIRQLLSPNKRFLAPACEKTYCFNFSRSNGEIRTGMLHLLTQVKPYLFGHYFVPKFTGENGHVKSQNTHVFTEEVLKICLTWVYQYTLTESPKYIGNIWNVTYKHNPQIKVNLLSTTLKKIKHPGKGRQYARHFPLQPEITYLPTEKENSAQVNVPPSSIVPLTTNIPLEIITQLLDVLKRLEHYVQNPTDPLEKKIRVGDRLFLGIFSLVQADTNEISHLNLSLILSTLFLCHTKKQLAEKLNGKEISLCFQFVQVKAIERESITVQFKNKPITLNYSYSLLDQTVYHDYKNRDLYKWKYSVDPFTVDYYYELELILFHLLKRKKACDFFLPDLKNWILRLCEMQPDIQAEINERFNWLEFFYQEK